MLMLFLIPFSFASNSPLTGLAFLQTPFRQLASPIWRYLEPPRPSLPPLRCELLPLPSPTARDGGRGIGTALTSTDSGIVVNAASAALFLNVRGHGSSIFRDGKRLVLAIFLFSAATWAQVGFITTLIDPAAENSCQIAIVFTTIFDQLARYSIEQHSLWVINDGTQASAGQIIPQVLLGVRFVLGAVFVGLSRPQFNTVCVPVSSVLALAITLVVVDAVIVAILAGRAISVGLIKKMQDGGQDSARSKAVVASLIGLTIWMAVSSS